MQNLKFTFDKLGIILGKVEVLQFKIQKFKFKVTLHFELSTLNFKYNQSGQSLIELLVAIALTGILLPAVLTGYTAVREGRVYTTQKVQAATLAKEAAEAVRSIRDESWDYIATNGTYYPVLSLDGSWDLTSGIQTIGDFTRFVTIEDVYRDSSQNIVDSGTVDPSTKKITVTVSWTSPFLSEYKTTFYLSRYLDNAIHIETTNTDFAGGVLNNVTISDNQVTLNTGTGYGKGDWCKPNTSIRGSLNLPRNGQARAINAIIGEAFVGTGVNASGVSLADIAISNTDPPVATIKGTINGFKTNDVFGESGYAYLASDDNAREVVVVATNTFTETGRFNSPGPTDADSVFVLGNIGYVITGNTLYTFDTTTKSGNLPQLGSTPLAGNGSSVYVVDSYAYIAVNSSATQMQIFQVSTDGKTLTLIGSLHLNAQGAKDIYISPDGTRAYLITANSATAGQDEFFVIDTTNKQSPTVIGSYNETTGMNPLAVDIVFDGDRAILVGTGGVEYQVLNISNEASPIKCGELNDDTGIYDIATVMEPDNQAYAYITSGETNAELKIIEGGGGGQISGDGTYESKTFDAGNNAAFNRFSATVDKPEGTDIKLKLAVTDAPDCNSAVFTFVGPSADPSIDDYFTASNTGSSIDITGIIPLTSKGGYLNPGRCLRYKVYFTPSEDKMTSPVFKDITINYTP